MTENEEGILTKEDWKHLNLVQERTFRYFIEEVNPENGLIADSDKRGAPSSIAAVGLALSCYPIAVERGFMASEAAAERALTTLEFFVNAPQGPASDMTGHHGFFYHFLDMETGRRAGNSEISTVDTSFLLAGALTAAAYFRETSTLGERIQAAADELIRGVNWPWMVGEDGAIRHGWRPGRGFIPYHYRGYNEALLMYILALGSPTYPLSQKSYQAWLSAHQWRKVYDIEFLYAGPLFIHQLPQVWLDLRGVQDEFMRAVGIDYFENSRRAVAVQRAYAERNPKGLRGYGQNTWGITASEGPGSVVREVDGRKRRFYGYAARGVPYGPDDGTLSPWAMIASLPFAPADVMRGVDHVRSAYPETYHKYGFVCSFNPTYPDSDNSAPGWVAGGYYGLNQGPIVLMIENYRNGQVWELMKMDPTIQRGMKQAGFKGGWLRGES